MISLGRTVLVLSGVTVLGATAWLGARTISSPSADPSEVLRAEEAVLRHRLTVSGQDRALLVLDPKRSTLVLYRGGTELRSWQVLSVEAGARRIGAGRGVVREDWRTHLWEDPQLDPPVRRDRKLIVSDSVVPPDPTGAVDWIPPTPEESVPTPRRFVVHFADGLGLEVLAEGPDSLLANPGLAERVSAATRRVFPKSWDRYRVRVRMPAAEAGSLYRAFPSGTAFVALIPERPPRLWSPIFPSAR